MNIFSKFSHSKFCSFNASFFLSTLCILMMFKESSFGLVTVVLPRVSHWKSKNLIVGVWNFAALNSYLKDLLCHCWFPTNVLHLSEGSYGCTTRNEVWFFPGGLISFCRDLFLQFDIFWGSGFFSITEICSHISWECMCCPHWVNFLDDF